MSKAESWTLTYPAHMRPQEERLFNALRERDWIDAQGMQMLVCGATPFQVILAKLKRKIEPLGYAIETDGDKYDRIKTKKWRLVLVREKAA